MSDGLLDVIIMEPFDILEASHVAFEMFNKTIDKYQKIKTFKAKRILIHRKQAGVIHFDGDPIMADADIEVKVINKGIKVVVNPSDKRISRKPNIIQTAFSELFCNIDEIRYNINKQSRKMQAINKNLLRKIKI